jgi:hypothetical protein
MLGVVNQACVDHVCWMVAYDVARPSPVPRLQPAGKASSLSKGSTPSSTTAAAAKKRAPLAPVADDEDMNRLVAAHNKRFKPQHTYQPSLSFRATRKVSRPQAA